MNIRHTCLRRILTAFLAALLSISSFLCAGTISVSADETSLPAITVENKTVHRGQTFELHVTLDNNPGLVAMVLELNYDKSVMKLVGVERGSALETHTFTTTNTNTDEGFLIEPFRLLWDGTAQDSTTGWLVTLTFESYITAPIGEYPVEFTYDANNTNSAYNTSIAVEIDNGIVELIKGEYSVVYKNYDGTILYEKDYNGDEMPSYVGETPTRPTDECYSYVFRGWKGAVSDDPSTICYVADYDRTPQIYQVLFYVDGEYFNGGFYPYGEFVDLSVIPSKRNHSFSGWYTDENYTQKVSSQRMTAGDLILYGYMKYNIREENIPQITLSVDRIEGAVAFVNVDVTGNSGLAGLVLTLDYDRTALELIGFEQGSAFGNMQFSHTNIENGYGAEKFKFYWENAENSYELGTIVTLKLKMNAGVPADIYDVTVTYDEKTDATYFMSDGELAYTRLDILGTVVPVSKIYHWNEEVDGGTDIDVTTEEGQSPDTYLDVKSITYAVTLPGDTVLTYAGENMEMKGAYTIRLIRNGEEIAPRGKIKIKIRLTEDQAACTKLKMFHVDENETMTEYYSWIEDGYLVFETDRLTSYWVMIGDYTVGGAAGSTQAPANTLAMMLGMSLLAIATMAFVLIMIAKNKKGIPVFAYAENE